MRATDEEFHMMASMLPVNAVALNRKYAMEGWLTGNQQAADEAAKSPPPRTDATKSPPRTEAEKSSSTTEAAKSPPTTEAEKSPPATEVEAPAKKPRRTIALVVKRYTGTRRRAQMED